MQLSGAELGEHRRLIFENVVNGVPVEDIRAAFHCSELEVQQAVEFVAKKIKEYRFRRHQPPLPCDTDFERKWNRRALLENVRKLGPVSLSTELLLPSIGVQTVDETSIREAAREVRATK